MAQITDHIGKLTGGITQQPPETRIKEATQTMVNAYPSAIQGLSKRRGAEFVSSLTSSAIGTTSFFHTIDRDLNEKYFTVTNSDGTVEVYDLYGDKMNLTLDSRAQDYLTTSDPSKNIRAVTAGDYTFLINRTRQTALKEEVVQAPAAQQTRTSHYLKYKKLQHNSSEAFLVDPTAPTKSPSYEARLELSVKHVNADLSEQTFAWDPFEDYRDIGTTLYFKRRNHTATDTVLKSVGSNLMQAHRQTYHEIRTNEWEYASDMVPVALDGSDPWWEYIKTSNAFNDPPTRNHPTVITPAHPVGSYSSSYGDYAAKAIATGSREWADSWSETRFVSVSSPGLELDNGYFTGVSVYWQMFVKRLTGKQKTFTASDGTAITLQITGVAINSDEEITITTNQQCYISAAYEDFQNVTVAAITDDTRLVDTRSDPKKNQSIHPAGPSNQDRRREIVLVNPRTLQNGQVELFTTRIANNDQTHSELAASIAATSVIDTDSDGNSFEADFAATSYNTGTGRIEINCTEPFYIDSLNEYGNSATGTMDSSTSYAGRNVTDFEDLPDRGKVGEVVRVGGQSDDGTDDYYVEWSGSRWAETVGFDAAEELDPDTMPQVLIRLGDGSWLVQPYSWRGRAVGDAVSNETPSFVGQQLSDVFLFQGRLGFCAGESVVLSEVSYYEQFYRSTCVQLEDDNRVDVELRFGRVELIHAALAVQDELILFSDKGQFSLNTNSQALTPKTVSAKQIGDYQTSTAVRPHAIGQSAFFTAEIGGYTQAREFFLGAAQDDRLLSSDLTIQCPQFITGDARYIQASRDNKAVFVLNRADPQSIWVYKFEYDGQTKVQSAWCRWDLSIGDIESIGIYGNYLYCVSSLGTERELTKIDVRDQQDLFGYELLRLDMQVTPTKTFYQSGISSSGDPETLLTIPYDGTNLVEVWDLTSGHTVNIDRYTEGGNLFVKGDYSAADLVVGIPYDMEVKLSTLYMRAPRKPQGEILVTDGRLTINYINIAYTDTATFSVDVSSRGRPAKTYHAGPRVGYTSSTFGDLPKSSGTLRVPVMTRNDNAEITLRNDSPFGCTILHVDWFGKHNPHARRV